MTPQVQQALTTKPLTREKIAAWIKYFISFDVHQTVRCTHIEGDQPHNSQLDYIESAFLNLHSSCVVMAARNAGKSYAAAIVILLECWFKPGIRCCVAAYQRNQSDFIYTYLIDFIAKFEARIGQRVIAAGGKRALGGNTNAQGHQYGPNGRGGTGKDVITFLNGSSVSFYSGGKSKTGVKGFHPHSLFIDECDLFTAEQFDGLRTRPDAGCSRILGRCL